MDGQRKEKSELGVKDGGAYVSEWGEGEVGKSERLPFDALTLTYCWRVNSYRGYP